LKAKDVQI